MTVGQWTVDTPRGSVTLVGQTYIRGQDLIGQHNAFLPFGSFPRGFFPAFFLPLLPSVRAKDDRFESLLAMHAR